MQDIKRHFSLKPGEDLLNNGGKGPIPFSFTGCYAVSISGASPFSYQFYSSSRYDSVRNLYSDKPILLKGAKNLIFCNRQGANINFDLFNKSNVDNQITLDFKFNKKPFSEKSCFFREWTLDCLGWKTPIQLTPNKEVGISPINFLGAHFEVHGLHFAMDSQHLSCMVEYRDETIADWFALRDKHTFKKPWMLHWTYPMRLHLKSDVPLTIPPDMIYFSGYNIRAGDVLEKVSESNLRSSFQIEKIRVA